MKLIKIGFLAGSFDLIHPGYIHMFKEAKLHCDYLVVGLQTNPLHKQKPILDYSDRYNILTSIRFVDEVCSYNTEDDLVELIKAVKPDIRFLGNDYQNCSYTGQDLDIHIHYIDRSHDWSTTKLKNLIKNQSTNN